MGKEGAGGVTVLDLCAHFTPPRDVDEVVVPSFPLPPPTRMVSRRVRRENTMVYLYNICIHGLYVYVHVRRDTSTAQKMVIGAGYGVIG